MIKLIVEYRIVARVLTNKAGMKVRIALHEKRIAGNLL